MINGNPQTRYAQQGPNALGRKGLWIKKSAPISRIQAFFILGIIEEDPLAVLLGAFVYSD